MGYKIARTFKKSKSVFIILGVLWIILSIALIMPMSVSIVEATTNGVFDFGSFIEHILQNIGNFGEYIGLVFGVKYIATFLKSMVYFTILLLFFAIIGLVKSMPKHEYTDIEHGSSDWSEGGEQYSILSKNKGILLAEKNYLPVDKRGNTNVLVVGGSGSRKVSILCYTKCLSITWFICIY